MKITLSWTPPGSAQPTTFILADSPANIPLANFRINGSRNLQEAQFLRAPEVNFYDRGNRKTQVTFDTTRLFADQVTAESFLLLHETQFPGQFLATFTAGSSVSGSTATRYLADAVVEAVSSSLTGCTTRHSYRLSGGVMTTSPN